MIKYRAEIDGLRAIAVISVILYHAQITTFDNLWLKGGFLGVDIFFVISGYLITKLIITEINNTNSFSFKNFYERRARRILPALLTVMLFSFIPAWFLILPIEFVEFSKSIISSLLFISNFFFYDVTSFYGAQASQFKPFLHTWSLSIEEQFYLFFPLFLIILNKFLKKDILTIFIFMFTISLVFSTFFAFTNTSLNFYFTPSRIWQLIAGSIIAYLEIKRTSSNKYVNQIFASIGYLLIFASLLKYEEPNSGPSIITLIPIFGVCLVIYFGSAKDVFGRIFSIKPILFAGLISYSLYLWHFPIFAFARFLNNFNDNLDKTLWIGLTIILSIASYYIIEKPFRNKNVIRTKVFLLILSTVLLIIISICLLIIKQNGFYSRLNEEQRVAYEAITNHEFRNFNHPQDVLGNNINAIKSNRCINRDPKDACKIGNERFVLLGDSFAAMLARTLYNNLKKYREGLIVHGVHMCPFTSVGIYFSSESNKCSNINKIRKNIFSKLNDKKIFIIASSYEMLYKPNFINNSSELSHKSKKEIALEGYFDNIDKLLKSGHKVVLIRRIPHSNKYNINEFILKNKGLVFSDTNPHKILENDNKDFPNYDNENVIVVDPVQALCVDKDKKLDKCMIVLDGKILYDNSSHLTKHGSKLVLDLVFEEMEKRNWISKERPLRNIDF